MTQSRCTIQDAARTLNIDRRKIYRMIERGLISKHSEDGKTFVLIEEIQAICAERTTNGAQMHKAHNERTEISAQERTHYIVDKEHYEGLLIKLGQMEAERRYLLEYKTGLEAKERELSETKATLAANTEKLAEIRAELKRARRPWWKRLFLKK